MQVVDILLFAETNSSIYEGESCGNAVIVEGIASMAITSLAGLDAIVDGGQIANNPLLPTVDVKALLAQIPGGDAVLVCGNLDGEPC
jgi:hypothetical protein